MVYGEADTEDESDQEGDPNTKPVNRIISIANDGQVVTLEGPDDLKTMAELAAYFWLLTGPPKTVTLGFTAGSTLVTERSEPYYEPGQGDE